jgi:hypothetical protein
MTRRLPIRLEDLLSSFRRHLRTVAKAPRTIELYTGRCIPTPVPRGCCSASAAR